MQKPPLATAELYSRYLCLIVWLTAIAPHAYGQNIDQLSSLGVSTAQQTTTFASSRQEESESRTTSFSHTLNISKAYRSTQWDGQITVGSQTNEDQAFSNNAATSLRWTYPLRRGSLYGNARFSYLTNRSDFNGLNLTEQLARDRLLNEFEATEEEEVITDTTNRSVLIGTELNLSRIFTTEIFAGYTTASTTSGEPRVTAYDDVTQVVFQTSYNSSRTLSWRAELNAVQSERRMSESEESGFEAPDLERLTYTLNIAGSHSYSSNGQISLGASLAKSYVHDPELTTIDSSSLIAGWNHRERYFDINIAYSESADSTASALLAEQGFFAGFTQGLTFAQTFHMSRTLSLEVGARQGRQESLSDPDEEPVDTQAIQATIRKQTNAGQADRTLTLEVSYLKEWVEATEQRERDSLSGRLALVF